MHIAVISDIHGNYTALQAVLKEIDSKNMKKVICLGDVATIGPQPKQVLAAYADMHLGKITFPALYKEFFTMCRIINKKCLPATRQFVTGC